MSKPFDATLKDLAREHAADFLAAFDAPPTRPVALLNVDLSTVTTSADLVVGLGDPVQEVVHIEFQSSASATKHADPLVYNGLLYQHYGQPVHSVVVLLRPQAGHYNLTGAVRYAARPPRGSMTFAYELIRLWERPADELLRGGLGTVPLATLGRLPEGVTQEQGLADVAQQLVDRVVRDAPQERASQLLTAAFVLSGLRVQRDQAKQIFRGIRAMRDSDTYMAIIDEGRVQEARRILLRIGEKRFGPLPEPIRVRLSALKEEDLDWLELLAERSLDVSTWDELLQTPRPAGG